MQLTGFTQDQTNWLGFLHRAWQRYPEWTDGLMTFQQAKRERLRRVVARRTGVLDARAPLMQCGECRIFRCKFR